MMKANESRILLVFFLSLACDQVVDTLGQRFCSISSIQMIGKTVTKSHSKAEIEYTAINKNSVREPLNIQNCEQGNYPNYLHGTIQLIEGNLTKVKLNKAYPKGTKMYITIRPVGLSTGFPTAVKVTH